MKNLFQRFLAILRAYGEKRDARLWQEWEDVLSERHRARGRLLEVVRIRQHAKTGTKAFAAELNEQVVEPIWAEGYQLRRGTYVLSTNHFRRGTPANTHHDENFWHIRTISQTVDVRVLAGWKRHVARKGVSRNYN